MDALTPVVDWLGLTPFAERVGQFFISTTLDRIGVWLAVAVVVAFATEKWAAFVHRAVWHRSLMFMHRSHHRLQRTVVEANDAFAVLHAPVAIAVIVGAVLVGPTFLADVVFGVGAGLTLFGMLYFVFHDGMVHGRLPVAFLQKVPMFARWRDAHHEHHRTGTYPYGFFRGPTELARRQSRAAGAPR